MKKLFIFLAVAILAVTACTKEIRSVSEQENTVSLSFTSERPQLDNAEPGTKTAWNSASSSIVWSEGDKIRVGYTLDGSWMGQSAAGTAKFYSSSEVTIDDNNSSIGTFLVPITGNGTTAFTDPGTTGTYKFYAISPAALLSNTTVSDPTAQNVTLAAAQTPGTNTFDKATDIMVGATGDVSSTGLPTDPIGLNWTRVVAHADLTFSNMAFSGTEAPEKITLTFNEAAKVAGTFSVNITDGTIGTGTTNVITLEGTGLTVSGTSIKAWASVLPVSFSSLNVEIKTDKATYTRNIASFTGGAKTFKGNARNTLTVNMAEATRVAEVQYDWVKTNLSAITASDVFVIVGDNGSTYAMSNDKGAQAAPDAIAVTVANNKLSAAPAGKLQWNLSKDGSNYTFYPNGTTETWLYCTNTNNGVRVGTNANTVFTLDDSGYLKHTGTSRYVGVYNSQDWRCYTSSTAANIANQTFSFFVRTASGSSSSKTPVTLSFANAVVNLTSDVADQYTGQAVTAEPNVAAITDNIVWSYSQTGDAAEDVDEDSGSPTLNGNVGSVTITATFNGDETYDSATASYTINVTPALNGSGTAADPYTASDAIAVAATLGSETVADVYVKGIVCTTGSISSGAVTYYISNDGTTTNRFQLYKGKYTDGANFEDETNLKLGDFVVVKGTLKYHNNTTAEFDAGSSVITVLRVPSFSPDGGIYTGAQSVTIAAESGATIYYTTDGSTPTTSSSVYSSAIAVSADMTIKAIAVKDGNATGVATAAYTINAAANDGSQSKPFTVAEVRAYMDASSSNRGPVYIQGTVSSIQSAYSKSYGTGIFFISDDGETTSDQFEAYSVKFLGNVAWTDGNTQIAVGDQVIIYGGTLTIFNTSIYETASNSGSYLYSLNGNTAAETVPTITKTDITGVAAAGVTNATTTVSFANNSGWAVSVAGDGTVVTSASISGTTITYSVAANSGDARTGSITVTLTKNGRTNAFEVISVAQLAGNGSTTETVSFTGGSSGGMTTTAGAQSGTKNGVTVDISNGVVSGEQIRIYKNATITITAPSGKTITKVEFTTTTSSGNYSSEGFPTENGYTRSGNTGTWVGSSGTVSLTASSYQVRATEIKVTYE